MRFRIFVFSHLVRFALFSFRSLWCVFAGGICCATLLFVECLAAQGVPALINYQGRILDSAGEPLSGNGQDHVQLAFRIYDQPSGGSLVWGPQVFDDVALSSGAFNILLGEFDAEGQTIREAFGAADRYIEIMVGSERPIVPRQRVVAAPYSLYSSFAQVSDTARNTIQAEHAVRADIASSSEESSRLGGFDWSALFEGGNPVAGSFRTELLGPESVRASQLAGGIGSGQLAPGAALGNLGLESVRGDHLAPGSISLEKLGPRLITSLREAMLVDGMVVGHEMVENSNSTSIEISAATLMPTRNRPPTANEGVEILRLTYIPKKTGNELVIEAVAWVGEESNITSSMIAALFVDGDSQAVAVAANNEHETNSNRHGGALKLTKKLSVDDTDPLTITLRAGPGDNNDNDPSGTWHINRMPLWVGGTWIMSEVGDPLADQRGLTSFLRVTEYYRSSLLTEGSLD